MLVNLKKIICVLTVLIGLVSISFASDNVLQAIQIEGVKDSYNIILKSDDNAELKKTIQAPNKMIILLNGIRASKTINTIYSNTSTVDSVVVEPVDEDSVKILIQAANVANAKIHFDSLKTPLGVLDNDATTQQEKPKSEILLSGPVSSFRPVYERENDDLDFEIFGNGTESLMYVAKQALNSNKTSWIITFGLFTILVLMGIGTIRRKENKNVTIGLTNHQNLEQREMNLFKNMNMEMQNTMAQAGLTQMQPQTMPANANYGLKSYQNNTRNPYVSSEIQKTRSMASGNMPNFASPMGNMMQRQPQAINKEPNALQKAAQEIIKRNAAAAKQNNTITKPTTMAAQKPKTANIDSMKFLESMTRIYEKNGRSDLAQGLKNNMQKAKVNIA